MFYLCNSLTNSIYFGINFAELNTQSNMEKTILILEGAYQGDDSLLKKMTDAMPGYKFEGYGSKGEVINAIENRFYALVILGAEHLDIALRIYELNPLTKLIIVFEDALLFRIELTAIVAKTNVLDFIDQQYQNHKTVDLLKRIITRYYIKISSDISSTNTILLQKYSEAKNEIDGNKKGILFERFISLLFGFLGYREITRRIVDSSRNEVDLSIRNEIEDSFLNKFGKYILLECKNIPNYKVSKNDFIVFNNKLENSNGLSELGIIATTGGFAKATYKEAMRESGTNGKILFLSNVEFLMLIQSDNKLGEFKKIIDEQMKSN